VEVQVPQPENALPMTETARPSLRWGAVARIAVPIAFLASLAAGLSAADAWLPLFPRELGYRITELFLRSLLIGYLLVMIGMPTLLVLVAGFLLGARRHQRRRPILARLALLLGSASIAVVAIELSATAWLGWVHRLPRLPLEFPAAPDRDGVLSLVVIGGSSAMGYPYDPNLSVGQIVAWQIEQASPDRKVDLDIRANLGKNLEEMHNGLASLRRRPDALIVYSGHNEFLSRFESSRDASHDESLHGSFFHGLYTLSLRSPFCLWVYETVRKHRVGGPPPPVNHHRLIDVPSFTTSELHQLLADFRRRLDSIVTYCQQLGAIPILVIPPANESGFEPNRTVLSVSPSPEREATLTTHFHQALALEEQDRAASIARYRALLASEPDFAEAHFRLGRLQEREGLFDEARVHYVAARDLDGFPVRCRSDFMRIYHEVAARRGCILIDGPEVLRARTEHGILDDSLFHDAHHPSFASQLILSQAIVNRLHDRRALGMGEEGSTAPVIEPAECAAHFRVNQGVWAAACVKAATYYRHLAASRYDPTEREAKHARFMRTGEDLRTGRIRAEDAGIPGIGLTPLTAARVEWWNSPPPVPPVNITVQ
jgi:hypothetical protein